jgi:hypothetical protein
MLTIRKSLILNSQIPEFLTLNTLGHKLIFSLIAFQGIYLSAMNLPAAELLCIRGTGSIIILPHPALSLKGRGDMVYPESRASRNLLIEMLKSWS